MASNKQKGIRQVPAELSETTVNQEHAKIQRIRTRSSYSLFRQLHDFLKDKPDIGDILKRFYDILDAKGGFGSKRNAEYAAESLDWVLKDIKDEENGQERTTSIRACK